MVRFYKSWLGRLLIGLILLIEIEKDGGKDAVIARIGEWQPPNEKDVPYVEQAIGQYLDAQYAAPEESPTNEELLAGIFGQFAKRKNDDLDLLDTIVNMLGLPFASFVSPRTIASLRAAILNPRELADFNATMKDAIRCGCGHKFTNHEMVNTVIVDGNISLQCTHCRRPEYVRCDYCDNVVHLNEKSASHFYRGIECGCRKKNEAQKNPPAPGPRTRTRGPIQMAQITPTMADIGAVQRIILQNMGATAAVTRAQAIDDRLAEQPAWVPTPTPTIMTDAVDGGDE